MSPQMGTSYLGLSLSGPLIASASPLTGRIDSLLALEAAGASAVVLPSLFEEEVVDEETQLADMMQAGEDFAEFSGGPLPDLDQPNLGAGRHRRLLQQAKDQLKIPVIASLNATRPGSWQRYATELADAGADALELNLYTVEANPLRGATEVELAHLAAIEAVKIAVDIPLTVKLSPYYSALSKFASMAVDAGADGLVLFNRFYAPDIDLDDLRLFARAELSDPEDQRLALRWIGILRGQLPEVSLACTSGVHTGTEVIKAILVGANVACTTSAVLRRGPEAVKEILGETARWMEEHGYASFDELRGAMSAASVPDPSTFERAQYQAVLHSGRHV
ncbi:MAG TPA: dihydroorotate dehydrogenase-like protein [Propionicimonas sp.]|nr:dihydroorotate dehydrogenase-like protein [Propionicimonas sp.]